MRWDQFLGHQRQIDWFRNAISSNRMASTFLLVGPEGVGKRTFARLLAKSLLCPHRKQKDLAACEHCESCSQVAASTHPDLIEVCKPEEKSVLPIDLFLGPPENRGREGFIHDIGLKPYHGVGKVAIVDDADFFNEESANALLKTLEEPPPGVRIFLIGTSIQRQLPTIRSRSQIIRFQGLAQSDLKQLIEQQGGTVEETDTGRMLLEACEGSFTAWQTLADPKLLEFRTSLFDRLAQRPIDMVGLSKAIVASVDSVGKEGPERKARLKTIFRFSIDFFRYQWGLASQTMKSTELDARLLEAMKQTRVVMQGLQQRPTRSILRTLDATYEVDRNIAPASIVEAWVADIAALQEA